MQWIGPSSWRRAARWAAGVLLCAAAAAPPAGAGPVSDADLVRPAGAEWLHTAGSYDGTRFSTLDQINVGNAARLHPLWISALGGTTDVQATPLYHDGILYIPQDNRLHAFDARTGDLLWRYDVWLPEDWGGQYIHLFTGKNRSAAIAGDTVFFVSNECAIHALDARTGKRRYRFKIDRPYPKVFTTTKDANGYVCEAGLMAIAGGKLIVPLNATDTGGLQGYVEGHRQKDGALLWAANMIPGPGEPGGDSWPGDSRLYGGAGPWIVGSWDPELHLYFTGTGNAYPWTPYSERAGRGAGNHRNEGAAAIVAVNTDSGKVAWRYTAVPGDPWDYDIPHTPMLVTLDGRRTVVQPNKTGFILYLEARTGRFLQAVPFADRITWAKGYDAHGDPLWTQPVPKPGQIIEYWPSMVGAVSVYPSAINPQLGRIYTAGRELGIRWMYNRVEIASNVRGPGATYDLLDGGKEVERSEDLKTGREVWRHETPKAGYAGGMLTTAGGLTLYATQGGELTAVDGKTGRVLWHFDANVTAKSGPMTYLLDGRQQITFALGGSRGIGSIAEDWNNINYAAILITLGL